MNLKSIVNFIIMLPLIWLFTGYFVFNGSDKIIVPIIVISIISSLLIYKNNALKKNYKDYFSIIILINIIYGSLLYFSIGFGSGEIRTLIAMFLYFLVIPKDLISKEKIYHLIFLASTICFIYLSYNKYILGLERGLISENYKNFNPIPYSAIISVCATIALHAFLDYKKKYMIIPYLLFFCSVFITETRGGILGLSISSLLMVMYKRRSLNKKNILIFITSVLFVLSLAYNSINERIVKTIDEIASISHGDMNTSIGLRLQMWKISGSLIELSPIIGHGDNHKVVLAKLYSDGVISSSLNAFMPSHFHNQYIDKLVKGGAIGLLLLLATQTSILSKWKKNRDNIEYQRLSISLFSLFVIISLTDIPFSQATALVPILFSIYFSLNVIGFDSTYHTELKHLKHKT